MHKIRSSDVSKSATCFDTSQVTPSRGSLGSHYSALKTLRRVAAEINTATHLHTLNSVKTHEYPKTQILQH